MEMLLTVKGLAEVLKLTPRKIRLLAEHRTIPCIALGPRTLRFRLSEVLDSLKEQAPPMKEMKIGRKERKKAVDPAGDGEVSEHHGEGFVPDGSSPEGTGSAAGEEPQVQPSLFGIMDKIQFEERS